jgi:hypothetical protein
MFSPSQQNQPPSMGGLFVVHGSTQFCSEDSTARGETGVYSLTRKLEALMSDWLDKFGCGKVSSTGDNDLAPGRLTIQTMSG